MERKTSQLKTLVDITSKMNLLARKGEKNSIQIYKEMFNLSETYEGKIQHLRVYRIFSNLMVGVNIREFLNIYPLKKTYDGEKYQIKDYYYSKRYVDTLLSITEVFRDENDVDEFLMEVLLEERIFLEVGVSMMMGASLHVEEKYGVDTFKAFFNYGIGRNNKKITSNYLKVVK